MSAQQCQKVFSQAHEWQGTNLVGYKNVLIIVKKWLFNLVKLYNGQNIEWGYWTAHFFSDETIKWPVYWDGRFAPIRWGCGTVLCTNPLVVHVNVQIAISGIHEYTFSFVEAHHNGLLFWGGTGMDKKYIVGHRNGMHHLLRVLEYKIKPYCET